MNQRHVCFDAGFIPSRGIFSIDCACGETIEDGKIGSQVDLINTFVEHVLTKTAKELREIATRLRRRDNHDIAAEIESVCANCGGGNP